MVRRRAEHNECEIFSLEEVSLHQQDIERIEHLQVGVGPEDPLPANNLIPRIAWSPWAQLHLIELFLVGNPCTEFEATGMAGRTEICRSERIRAAQGLEEVRGESGSRSEYLRGETRRSRRRRGSLQDRGQKQGETAGAAVTSAGQDLSSWSCKDRLSESSHVCPEQRQSPLTPEAEAVPGLGGPVGGPEGPEEDQEETQRTRSSVRGSSGTRRVRSPLSLVWRLIATWRKRRAKDIVKEKKKPKTSRTLITADGRVMNDEETNTLVLDLAVYRHMDSSLIDVDVQPTYARVTVKGKVKID
ncbi:hypothetical protein INR49_007894 [Caranx melampygus]|nr:hypothetical protein INR49_007894 [Caranx melampygus]